MEPTGDLPLRLLVTLVALAAVLLLAWAVLRFATSLGGRRGGGGRLQVLETLPLGSRERLVLVRLDSRELLVGVATNRVELMEMSTAETAMAVRSTGSDAT